MSLEEIVNEIEETRKKTISILNEELQSKEKELESEFQVEVKNIEEEFRKRSFRELKNFEKREIDLSDLEASKLIQTTRYELLKGGLEKIGQGFRGFTSDAQYEEFLSKGLEIAKTKLGKLGEIRCRKADSPIINKLAGTGIKITESGISGGFIASTITGKMEIDLSLENLFASVREEIEEILSSKIG